MLAEAERQEIITIVNEEINKRYRGSKNSSTAMEKI